MRKIHWRRDRLLTLVFLGSPVTQLVKNLPAVQDTWVQSLHLEEPLETGTATHSSTLAWRSPWTILCGHKESDTTERLSQTICMPEVMFTLNTKTLILNWLSSYFTFVLWVSYLGHKLSNLENSEMCNMLLIPWTPICCLDSCKPS